MASRIIKGVGLAAAVLIGWFCLSTPAAATATLALQRLGAATELSQPLYLTAPPGDTSRVFVLEKTSGLIRILQNSQFLPHSFLDLSPRFNYPFPGYDQGLICMAFHPQYAQNGYFYVIYTDSAGASVLARYSVSSNPDSAIFNSQVIILRVMNPTDGQNMDMAVFGPDSDLYVAYGDGETAAYPQTSQDGSDMHGKILRLDVDHGLPYTIPPDNPFVTTPGFLPEIWAVGLRQPWRCSFDRLTGDFYLGDVGSSAWEEVDYTPAGHSSSNYGWSVYEGPDSTGYGTLNPQAPQLIMPVYAYPHNGDSRCVISGYVYRGSRIPALTGTYFCADNITTQIWSWHYDGQTMSQFHEWTQELCPAGSNALGDISSFGEDAQGELYITDYNQGAVFKIVPASHLVLVRLQPTTSPVVIPPGGGAFSYMIRVSNPNAFPVIFDVWNDVFTPSYHSMGIQISRFNVQIPGGAAITRTVTQSIPGTAAPGSYALRSFVGDYPTLNWDESWFSFVKQAGTADLAVKDWAAGGWDTISEAEPATSPVQTNTMVCSPNPFNPTTDIRYKIQDARQVSLKVYDTVGRLVATLVDGWAEAGDHRVTFDGSNLSSGIYLYRIQAGEWSAAGKMALIK